MTTLAATAALFSKAEMVVEMPSVSCNNAKHEPIGLPATYSRKDCFDSEPRSLNTHAPLRAKLMVTSVLVVLVV